MELLNTIFTEYYNTLEFLGEWLCEPDGFMICFGSVIVIANIIAFHKRIIQEWWYDENVNSAFFILYMISLSVGPAFFGPFILLGLLWVLPGIILLGLTYLIVSKLRKIK